MLRLAVVASLLLAVAPEASAGQPARTAGRPTASAPRRTAAPGKTTRSARPRWGPVELYHINHRETLKLRIADDKGRTVPGVQRRVDRFLRCHYTKKQCRMHPRLARLLYEVGRHWPGKRLEVVSGYRHPKVAKNPRSPHMKGLACDFRVSGVSNTELRDFLRSRFSSVGVGYYPNSSFVHLDVRQGASAFWIDYSGPGETALYADDPKGDLASGRAESFRPTKIDPAWADDDREVVVPARADEADQDGQRDHDATQPDEAPEGPAASLGAGAGAVSVTGVR